MFAVIVGNIGLIITSMDEEHSAFYNIVDKTKKFMLKKEIPQDTQDRVKRWYGMARHLFSRNILQLFGVNFPR